MDKLPSQAVLDEIDAKVDTEELETVLMREGILEFTRPQEKLLRAIAAKRAKFAA